MRLPHLALWRSLGRPQCGFHISAPAFSPRKASQGQCACAKRYSTAPHMKRVQRVNDSLAQVWGRAAPNVLPAVSYRISKPYQKERPPNTAFLFVYAAPIVPRRDRHKKTHKPKVNQTSPITAQSHENVLRRSRPGGIETQHPASRPVWRARGKQQA